jgi:hypothetical protein
MKKIVVYFLAVSVSFFASLPLAVQAQKGNPLNNIAVTAFIPGTNFPLENARISIDDFDVEGNTIYVSSTLTGAVQGQAIPPISVRHPITITASSCEMISLIIGDAVAITNESFTIGNVSVNISSKLLKNDKHLTNTLCSIAKLYQTNASPNVIVAKLKQLIRTFS